MTRDELETMFPLGCHVRATDRHCRVDYQIRTGDYSPHNYVTRCRYLIDGLVVGYSRNNRCIRIIKRNQRSPMTYHHSFYEVFRKKARVDKPGCNECYPCINPALELLDV